MYCIQIHNGIQKIIEFYSRFGLWHLGDKATVKETLNKTLFFVYYSLFPISLQAGAILSDNKNESVLLLLSSIICTVVVLRLFYIIRRQKQITELLNGIGVYSIKDENVFTVTDEKLKSFMKWITYFYYYVIVVATCVNIVLPIIGTEKQLFLNVAFPLDYKNNALGYWMAFIFVCSEVYLSVFITSFSIIVWYLLFNCVLKYKALGSELRNLGVIVKVDAVCKKPKISEVEKRMVFNCNLSAGIKSYQNINEETKQLELFLSELFSVQLATSAICICASVYIIAFNNNANIIEYLIYIGYIFYNIFDIFVVLYLGNEIEMSSDGLSYCLFQSNWIDQLQSCKRNIIIFGERLKQSQRLLILKIYPLTLETFMRILNGAYSLFNILKTMAK